MNNASIERAAALLEQEFGPNWLSIAQQLGTENLRHRVGKDLTSFMAFPDRGGCFSNPPVCAGYQTLLWQGHLTVYPVRSHVRVRYQQSYCRQTGG